MFSVLVIRLRSLRLLRVSGIVMRLRMFLLLIDRKSGSAGMPRPSSYAVFCLKKQTEHDAAFRRPRARQPMGRGKLRAPRAAALPLGSRRAAVPPATECRDCVARGPPDAGTQQP